MEEFRTIATFRSTRFPPPADGLPAATDALVSWMLDELRRGTDFRVHEPDDQDWGAFIRVERGRAEYQLNFAVDDGSPPEWMLEVQDPPRSLRRVLARRNPLDHGRLVQAVHTVLSAEPSISGLRWHLGTVFGKDDRSSGAATPDRVPAELGLP
jgi:hypothetical protein